MSTPPDTDYNDLHESYRQDLVKAIQVINDAKDLDALKSKLIDDIIPLFYKFVASGNDAMQHLVQDTNMKIAKYCPPSSSP